MKIHILMSHFSVAFSFSSSSDLFWSESLLSVSMSTKNGSTTKEFKQHSIKLLAFRQDSTSFFNIIILSCKDGMGSDSGDDSSPDSMDLFTGVTKWSPLSNWSAHFSMNVGASPSPECKVLNVFSSSSSRSNPSCNERSRKFSKLWLCSFSTFRDVFNKLIEFAFAVIKSLSKENLIGFILVFADPVDWSSLVWIIWETDSR